MGFLKNILSKGKEGDDSPEALQNVKWGMASPLMLRLTGGIESIRAFGTFSCKVIDTSRLRQEGCNIDDQQSVEEFRKYLSDLIVNSFREVLGRESSLMSMEELISGAGKLARETVQEASTVISEKGLELTGLVVMKIIKV